MQIIKHLLRVGSEYHDHIDHNSNISYDPNNHIKVIKLLEYFQYINLYALLIIISNKNDAKLSISIIT